MLNPILSKLLKLYNPRRRNAAKVIKDIVGDEMLFKKFYGSC